MLPSPSAGRSGSDHEAPRRLVGRFRASLAAGFIFSAVINLLLLSLPLYSLQVFSRAIPSGNTDTLAMLTVLVVIALSLMAVLEIIRARLFSRAGAQLELVCRERLMEASVDSGARGRADTGPLADLMEIRGLLARPTLAALFDLPWTPLYVLGISLISPILGGLMVAVALILWLLAVLGDALTRDLGEEARIAGARSSRLAEAMAQRGDSLRGLRMQNAAIHHWSGFHFAGLRAGNRSQERAAGFQSVARWVRYLLQIGVTGVAAGLVMNNQLSMGGMIATSLLVGRAMAPIEQITGAWGTLRKAAASWRRLSPLLKRLSAQTPAPGPAAGPGQLVVENVLLVSPRDQRPILKGLSFALEPGEILCIFGPNRSGKSSLARLLAGAIKPQAGSVRLDGVEVSAWRPPDPRQGIGYVPQQVELLPGTVAENIARFMPAPEADIHDVARRVGAHDVIAALPQGYDTDGADAPGLLSGGTERLIALARAALGAPSLLVLDEPAGMIDVAGMEAMRRFLTQAKADGITTVILSHQSAFLDLADKVMVLNHGAVAAYGPRDHVIGARPPRPAQMRQSPIAAETQP